MQFSPPNLVCVLSIYRWDESNIEWKASSGKSIRGCSTVAAEYQAGSNRSKFALHKLSFSTLSSRPFARVNVTVFLLS